MHSLNTPKIKLGFSTKPAVYPLTFILSLVSFSFIPLAVRLGVVTIILLQVSKQMSFELPSTAMLQGSQHKA